MTAVGNGDHPGMRSALDWIRRVPAIVGVGIGGSYGTERWVPESDLDLFAVVERDPAAAAADLVTSAIDDSEVAWSGLLAGFGERVVCVGPKCGVIEVFLRALECIDAPRARVNAILFGDSAHFALGDSTRSVLETPWSPVFLAQSAHALRKLASRKDLSEMPRRLDDCRRELASSWLYQRHRIPSTPKSALQSARAHSIEIEALELERIWPSSLLPGDLAVSVDYLAATASVALSPSISGVLCSVWLRECSEQLRLLRG